MDNNTQNWQLTLTVDKQAATDIQDFYEETALAVSIFEVEEPVRWQVTIVLDHEPVLKALQETLHTLNIATWDALSIAPIENIDWLTACYEQFPAFEWEGYYLFGSHIDPATCPEHLIPLQIGAATAFGSGEHATTQGCLTLFNHLIDAQQISADTHLLDMGCGSGILAIAAAKKIAFKQPVIGVDIDKQAVSVAIENAAINHVADQLDFSYGDGFAAPIVTGKKFDLIFANILANPLIEMAHEMAQVASKYIILSGLLQTQESSVIKAYEAQGFELLRSAPIKDWQALLMRKKDGT